MLVNNFYIFFDDGGVLNNNEIRGREWRKYLAKYFVNRFGGEPKKWKKANIIAATEFMDEMEKQSQKGKFNTNFFKNLHIKWIETMFNVAGVDIVDTDKYDLSREVSSWVIARVRSSFQGIVGAIKSISPLFSRINTASNELQYELEGYLRGMGILNLFTTLYGVDLLGYIKPHVKYYEEIFDKENVDPTQCIFVEDNPENLKVINQLGSIAIQANQHRMYDKVSEYYYEHPKDLVKIVENIVNN